MDEHFEKSMIYERAYAECINIKLSLGKKENAEAKENGGEVPKHYEVLRKELTALANKFRGNSDSEYNFWKAGRELNEDGITNLANAVIEQMALDYESALSNKDLVEQAEIERFAREGGRLYTALDVTDIVSRIAADHKRFKKMSHERFADILRNTEKMRKAGIAFADRRNKYRCPLCHGGVYVKSKPKSNLYVVACSGCELTEVVKVNL